MHVSLQSLSCRRGDRMLFDGLSAELGPGEALMIRGPNGSGKSSLLRILAGFLAPAGGHIGWKDDAGDAWQEEGLEARLTYLGHANGVKAQLTVRENVRFWATLMDASGAEGPGADETPASPAPDLAGALAYMGLSGLEDMPAGLLSAGQQRRLALCRLPLGGRKLWLLDEPEAALDTASRDALSALIIDHLRTGGLALIASHSALDVPGAATLSLEAEPHTEGHL